MTARFPFDYPGAYATTLLVAAIDAYGLELTTWAPETIEMELDQLSHGTVIEPNVVKVLAAVQLMTTDTFFNSLPDFCTTCVTFSGHPPLDGSVILPDSDDIAWAVTEASLIMPPEDEKEGFTDEIATFVGKVLEEESILTVPDALKFAVQDGDPSSKIRTDFSDDPTMYNAVFDMDTSRTQDINNLVTSRVHGLLKQLRKLQLRSVNGKHLESLINQIASGLPKASPVDLVDA